MIFVNSGIFELDKGKCTKNDTKRMCVGKKFSKIMYWSNERFYRGTNSNIGKFVSGLRVPKVK